VDIDRRKAKKLVLRLWMYEIILLSLILTYSGIVLYLLFLLSPILVFFGVAIFYLYLSAPQGEDLGQALEYFQARKFGKKELVFVKPFFEKNKLPIPVLWVVQNEHIFNAFAFTYQGKHNVAVSERMFLYGERKLYSVLAHEMAHFDGRDTQFDNIISVARLVGTSGTILYGIIVSAASFSFPTLLFFFAIAGIFSVVSEYFMDFWFSIGQEARADVRGALYTEDVEAHMEMLLDICAEYGPDMGSKKIVERRISYLLSVMNH